LNLPIVSTSAMSQRCRDMCKTILSDAKFDLNSFLSAGYSDLWTIILEHLRECDLKCKRKGSIINRPKYVDSKPILAALARVVPRARREHYRPEMAKPIDTVFRCYLHPHTPNHWRLQAFQIFCHVIRTLPDSSIPSYQLTIASIVPYSRFATSLVLRTFFSRTLSP
jgi:hypothetical protein